VGRNLAAEIPVWDQYICIQCNKCALVCPHAAIRAKVFEPAHAASAPPTFKTMDYKAAEFRGQKYVIQVAPEDCTGCNLCVETCPAKDKANPRHKALDMAPQEPLLDAERTNYQFFLDLPEPDRAVTRFDVKGSQFLQPLWSSGHKAPKLTEPAAIRRCAEQGLCGSQRGLPAATKSAPPPP
jgi:pyruvate-ferredoxin/flavodoxin oxidoreductase